MVESYLQVKKNSIETCVLVYITFLYETTTFNLPSGLLILKRWLTFTKVIFGKEKVQLYCALQWLKAKIFCGHEVFEKCVICIYKFHSQETSHSLQFYIRYSVGAQRGDFWVCQPYSTRARYSTQLLFAIINITIQKKKLKWKEKGNFHFNTLFICVLCIHIIFLFKKKIIE